VFVMIVVSGRIVIARILSANLVVKLGAFDNDYFNTTIACAHSSFQSKHTPMLLSRPKEERYLETHRRRSTT